MAHNILSDSGRIKEIVVNTQGTPTQKLLAILAAAGIESTAELAELIGVQPRAIQKAKRPTGRVLEDASELQDASHSSPANYRTPKANSGTVARVEYNNNITNLEVRPVSEVSTPLPPKRSRKPKADGPTNVDAMAAFHAYNETALRCGLPQASKLTPQRSRAILARLKTHGVDGWATALANIERSAFLRGKTDHQFRADLDFVCQAKSFDRLHDGGYGNGAIVKPQTGYRQQPPPLITRNTDIRQTPELDAWIRDNCLVERSS